MMQLDTKNLFFRQMMGNGIKYSVPRFQRDYSWQEDQWEDLWEDALEVFNSRPGFHYMGYLVLQQEKNNITSFVIIDGKQRLVTISIIILAIQRELKELEESGHDPEGNQKRRKAVHGSFIGFTDPVSLKSNYKLNLNRNNDRYFKTYLCELKDPPVRKINRSEKLMGEAFGFFRQKIKSCFEQTGQKLEGEKAARFIESIANKLIFTVITVESDTNAYTVFETLNARGVRLSVPDLVKNFVFSLIDQKGDAHNEQIKNLEDKWSNITGQLGRQKFSSFIRADWNSRHDFSRENELFKKIKGHLNSAGRAKDYLDHLQKNSEIYAAFQSGEDEFWKLAKEGVYNKEGLKHSLTLLSLFNIVAPHSVLISAFHRFSPPDFERFLYYIETLSVRYNIICQKSTGPQERVYSEAAKIISSSSPEAISSKVVAGKILKKIYPSDEEFVNAFKVKTFKTRQTEKKARYFLYRIERHLKKAESLPSYENVSLEHIAPQNPSAKWNLEEFEEEGGLEDWTGRIGNMTLLSIRQNKELGNEGFDKKTEVFQKSPFQITRKCLEYKQWNKNAIRSRQEWLADFAKKAWSFS